VEHDAVDVPATGRDGHLERRGDQRGAQVVGDPPADDAAGEQVDHGGQEQPALAGGDVAITFEGRLFPTDQ
jgi:hypothetical protein